MGNAASTTPRAVLYTAPQVFFAGHYVKKDAMRIVSNWHQDGSPLALSSFAFRQVLGLSQEDKELAPSLYQMFDTDKNGKVDWFEVLSSIVLLSHGDLGEKLEVIFPVFDFSQTGHVSFDEVQILLHSICRGLSKVCDREPPRDADIMQVARHMFDSHNLTFDKTISQDQVKRWAGDDVEAVQYFNAFHKAVVVSEARAEIQRITERQGAIFSGLEASADGVLVAPLLENVSLRDSLGNPSGQVLSDIRSLISGHQSSGRSGGAATLSRQRFNNVMVAWNTFVLLDTDRAGFIYGKELRSLLWLACDTEEVPSVLLAEKKLEDLKLGQQDRITLPAWLGLALAGLT